jgi:hypothetical protein
MNWFLRQLEAKLFSRTSMGHSRLCGLAWDGKVMEACAGTARAERVEAMALLGRLSHRHPAQLTPTARLVYGLFPSPQCDASHVSTQLPFRSEMSLF